MNGIAGYATKLQQVAVVNGAALEIRSLTDRQQYCDPHGEAAAAGISPACWSLFGQLWPSAQKLADLMQTWDVAGCRVLEIGCGLALASLVVHRRLGDVTASDSHPLAEAFLRDNLHRNDLPPMKYATGNWMRANPALGRFDLIIGSDVLYERDHPAQLADFIASHAAPHAAVLIVDPNRGNRRAFSQHMERHGFALTASPLSAPLQDGTPYKGQLLHYLRAAAG